MKCSERYGTGRSVTCGLVLLMALPFMFAVAACGGDDRGLHNELQAFPPGAASLPQGYSVSAMESLDLGAPLHNNRGATYRLSRDSGTLAEVRLSIVTFTHRDAALSYVTAQMESGELRGVADGELEQGDLFAPAGLSEAVCVEGEHESEVFERVCVLAVDRTVVVSNVLSNPGEELPAISFDVSLLEAGRSHAQGLLAGE